MSLTSQKRISKSDLCTVNYGKEKSYIYVNKTPVYKGRTALFWVATQRVVVISYRRFGTNFRSHPQGSRILRLSRNVGNKLSPLAA
jgi:hypothetical protein